MGFFVLLAYASFAASKTLLRRLLAYLNLTLDSEDLFCWYKQKSWFLWTMAASQAAEKHADEWGLTWNLRWVIYIYIYIYIKPNLKLLTKFTSRSVAFKDIFQWSISQTITKTVPISTRIVINQWNKASCLSLFERQWKLRQQHDHNFPMAGKPF